ncbi:MAG TPA: hypothetical protein VHL09_14730 [Dehalococcoidia bacterium]|nr:hypothetical protein [Dehalococcoidia bacterium]
MADRGGPPVRSPGWIERGRAEAGGGRDLGPERRARQHADILEGLAHVSGIEVVELIGNDSQIWIRCRDGSRTGDVARALRAESLPVAERADGALGLPWEPWFRRDDVTAVVLCVTKVAHHLALDRDGALLP